MKQQTTAYLASRQFHKWLIPEKTVMGLFSLGVILVFVGAILLAVSSVASGALAIIGGILLAIGFILLIICMCLCTHAWCVWYVRDGETQTVDTVIVGGDQMDGTDWYSTYGGTPDKRVPNGVLRDGRQPNTLTKKHVTISPRSNESFSSGYMSGRQADSLRSNEYSRGMKSPTSVKSGPSSVSSDVSTLASFAYLNDPSLATPYSSLNQKRQMQGNAVNVPIHVQGGYGSVPRQGEPGRMAQVRPYHTEQGFRSNAPSGRRHSDDDYDNTGEMVSMLPQQSFQPAMPQQQWQQPWQQQQQQQSQYNQHWQQTQPPPQQTVWQYQTTPNQSNWRQFDEPPPQQPLVRPSQRRPMTFEQMSSSKVSLYDNMQMARRDEDE